MRYWLITGGAVLIVLGLIWPLIMRSGLGRLPGDISIHRPGFDFYLPVTTSLILSIVLSLIVWWLRR
jgi:hypothetical protein